VKVLHIFFFFYQNNSLQFFFNKYILENLMISKKMLITRDTFHKLILSFYNPVSFIPVKGKEYIHFSGVS